MLLTQELSSVLNLSWSFLCLQIGERCPQGTGVDVLRPLCKLFSCTYYILSERSMALV